MRIGRTALFVIGASAIGLAACGPVDDLEDDVDDPALEVESDTAHPSWCRSSLNGGVAGVYNRATKKVEWKSELHSGVAGVYNPLTREVVWRSALNSGVAIVYNPRTRKVESR